jgi:hypothetical protein
MKSNSNLKSLIENLLSENQDVIGITGVQSPNTVFTQREVPAPEDTVEEKIVMKTFTVQVNGKTKWEGPAKDKKDAITRAEAEYGEDFTGEVKVYEKEAVNEEEIVLSPKSFRTLYNCFIAEQMVNESVEIDESLGNHGLITEGKITDKGRNQLKLYLPTLFAS